MEFVKNVSRAIAYNDHDNLRLVRVKTKNMTESQLKQVIEFAHQAGQRNAGIDASPQAARDYYQSLVQDGGLSIVSKCGDCKPMEYYESGIRYFKCRKCGELM